MSALDRKDLNKFALASGITGLPLDDVVSLASEKNRDVIAEGVPNVPGTRYLDKSFDSNWSHYEKGMEIKSCWGHGMSHLIRGGACPFMRQISWTDRDAHERKAIAYCIRIKPLDIAAEYSCRNLVVSLFDTPKLDVPEDVKTILDSLHIHTNITIATPGIVYDASRAFCERADDGFPKFCPLPREL